MATYTATKTGIRLGETKVCDFWTSDRDGVAVLVRQANAAADMLAALREVLRCSALPEHWAAPVRAAIAKATGDA